LTAATPSGTFRSLAVTAEPQVRIAGPSARPG
jgi:hypothetical protein